MKFLYSEIRFVLSVLFVVIMLWQGNALGASKMDEALNHYLNADFEKAQSLFKKLADQRGSIENCQKALAYLALTEIALNQGDQADNSLFKLLVLDPSFDLEQVEDTTPELEKRFDSLKSRDIIKAIGHYQNADFGKAKNTFKTLTKSGVKRRDREVAFAYLALIETALEKQAKADEHLSELAALNPSFELRDIGDMSPDIEKRFRDIRSGKAPKSSPPPSQEDTVKPAGELTGIGEEYKVGDKISYKVRGSDDKALKKITFSVTERSDATTAWVVSSRSADYQSSFSTKGWDAGTYHYTLLIEDGADNSEEYTGSFSLSGKPEADTTKPTGKVTGIGKNHVLGETISYTVTGSDNHALKTITFSVKGSSVKKTWNTDDKSASYDESFSTKDWKPGTYDYLLHTEDAEGNAEEITESFVLAKKADKAEEAGKAEKKDAAKDKTSPTGKVSRIRKRYTVGDKVRYTISAKDDSALRKMTFQVKKSSVNKSWKAKGKSASQKSSFSTKRWKPGEYHYAFLIEDSAGNTKTVSGSFALNKKTDDKKPTGEVVGIEKHYIKSDTISYTVRAKDDHALSKITFKVRNHSSATKIWKIKEKSADRKSSFSSKGWKAGTYEYTLLTEDSAGNTHKFSGNFVLAEERDTLRPSGRVSRIRDAYNVGDTIHYSVDAQDNRTLKKISFLVGDVPMDSWDVSDASISVKSSFSTYNWRSGIYEYTLLIEDAANNSKKYTGKFTLYKGKHQGRKKPAVPLSGKVIGIEKQYLVGATIHYTVQAKDDKSLRKMTFKTNKVKEAWSISGKTANRMSFFSTRGWKPGTYTYQLLTEDSDGNVDKHEGRFDLAEKPKPDQVQPTGQLSKIRENYEEGDTVSYAVRAEDNKDLKKISFSVKNSSVRKAWNVSGRSADRGDSFSTAGWKAGTYECSLSIEDSANNSQTYKKSFVLANRSLLSPFDNLRQLKKKFSKSYNEYVGLKEKKKQDMDVDSQLALSVKKIIRELKEIEAAYKKMPPTPEVKEGLRRTQNALEAKERELKELNH
ncbi:MAG: hypothetical protein B6245_10980 [Desulfobacteraceae bacterium 4572_88]|nr:MAG: hypothetical protein B6245_10980 [Desulfobacteraceae bacterium 4572_88]RLC20190.1 MAG: hypothetical protein DRI57_05410 [Deltaproteobacteria bacterium]